LTAANVCFANDNALSLAETGGRFVNRNTSRLGKQLNQSFPTTYREKPANPRICSQPDDPDFGIEEQDWKYGAKTIGIITAVEFGRRKHQK
jgi:hypothetical protein